ncbi:MAG: hypothetical protein IT260_11845, partial [Saprospiraceae bacterium]|nr:hypothetical protein [Saprospiraceae bacterium]
CGSIFDILLFDIFKITNIEPQNIEPQNIEVNKRSKTLQQIAFGVPASLLAIN